MSKGLTLEQLREEMSTDATQRNAAQEVTIKKQMFLIASLEQEIREKNILLGQMFNRCHAYSHAALCLFCGCRSECAKHYMDAEKKP